MRKQTAIAYWLIPAQPEQDLFRVIIRILAIQFDAPQFEPHVTILVAPRDRQPRNDRGSRTLSESPAKILQRITAAPIRLRLGDVGFSSKFTKTLFVRLKSSKSLEKLMADL